MAYPMLSSLYRRSLAAAVLLTLANGCSGDSDGTDSPDTACTGLVDEPLDGAALFGTVPVVARDCDDRGVASVRFLVDDAIVAEVDAAPFSYEWRTDEFEEGPHTVNVIATYLDGETSEVQVDVFIDRTPPVLTIVEPTALFYELGSLAYGATAVDNHGVQQVEWSLDDAIFESDDSAPYVGTLDMSEDDAGVRILTATAVDHAGHYSTASAEFEILLEGECEERFAVNEADFGCLTEWEGVRGFYMTNLLGNSAESLRIAEAGFAEPAPVGTVVQLIPQEAMVKLCPGTRPATNDWEYFVLGASAEGTTITERGFEDIENAAGTCNSCHAGATARDFICEDTLLCAAAALPRPIVDQLVAGDPRCR
ncbi:MAG: hypothetical protein ACJA1R_001985 [Flavobacteriales bacterium]|jgi:hypothetical protein